MTKRKVEVFTAGCPACEPIVEMVNEMACPSCEVIVHNVAENAVDKELHQLIKVYGISSLPSVVVNGNLLTCCTGSKVSREELEKAGVGKAI